MPSRESTYTDAKHCYQIAGKKYALVLKQSIANQGSVTIAQPDKNYDPLNRVQHQIQSQYLVSTLVESNAKQNTGVESVPSEYSRGGQRSDWRNPKLPTDVLRLSCSRYPTSVYRWTGWNQHTILSTTFEIRAACAYVCLRGKFTFPTLAVLCA
jgi:hypothetical protein